MEENSPKGPPPNDKNAAAKNTAEIEMELKDFGFHQEQSKLTKKKEMELADLRNVDLTAWKSQDLKALFLKLKLKATGTKPELIERLRIFQEANELLEKTAGGKQQICISHKFGRIRSSSTLLCLESQSIIIS